MPYNPDGSFTLAQNFGTGTALSNQFPNQVGVSLSDIATSIAISNLFSQAALATTDVAFKSVVAGTPTGGNKGAGSINAESIFINGATVSPGSGFLVAANNLSDVVSATTSRSNLSSAAKSQVFSWDFGLLGGFATSVDRTLVASCSFAGSITKFFV